MTTEFKDALENMAKSGATSVHYNTLRRALLIADKLMQEPSYKMEVAGYDVAETVRFSRQVFKAMRDQMIKEIEK